jgi:hypothetical protein
MPVTSSSIRTLPHAVLGMMLLAASAQADIYKYVDKEGRITYSNVPIKGAQKLDLGPLPVIPAPRTRVGSRPASAAPNMPSPVDFPRVDASTQSQRDQTRLQLLLGELASEEKLLADARQKLAASPADPRLRDSVKFHELNIQMLNKEMSRLK